MKTDKHKRFQRAACVVLAGLLALYYLRRAHRRVIQPLADQDYRF